MMKKERIYYLDIVKVAALIMVFTCHFTRSLEKNGVGFVCKVLPDRIFNLYIGSFGVTLFFIASGASLMYVYGSKIDNGRFLLKRFTGIYPMFWLAFLTATAVSFFRNQAIMPQGIPKWKILYSILGCDGNALWWGSNYYQLGEWFLSVIILLYLLFPLLRICVNKAPLVTMTGSVLLLIICILFFKTKLPIECFVLARVAEFVFGMIFIRYVNRPSIWQMMIGVVGLGLTAFVDLSSVNVMLQTIIVGISGFLVISWVGDLLARFQLTQKISGISGKYCYPFFLTHHYLLEWMTERFQGITLSRSAVYLLYFSCFAVTIVVTKLLYEANRIILDFFSLQKKHI